MLDFQQLRAQEHRFRRETVVRRKKGGSLVSQRFSGFVLHVPLPLRQPTSQTMCNMQQRRLDLVRVTLEKCREADLCHIVSRWDRLLIFGGCNIGALACFVLCFALWPIMMGKPRKFAIL